jgi:hypothetical protein
MDKYRKFWVAVIGGAAASAVAVFGGDTLVGKIATVVLAGATAAGVYGIKNEPMEES